LAGVLTTWMRAHQKDLLMRNLDIGERIVMESNMQPGVVRAILEPAWSEVNSKGERKRVVLLSQREVREMYLFHSVDSRFGQLLTEFGAEPHIFTRDDELVCGNIPRNKEADVCTDKITGDLYHVVNCRCSRYPMHQAVLGGLTSICREAGIPLSSDTKMREATDGRKGLFADTIAYLGGLPKFIDVTVRSPFAGDFTASMDKGKISIKKPLVTALKAKRKKYQEAADMMNVQFVPAAMTHLGVMGDDFIRLIHEVANFITNDDLDKSNMAFDQLRHNILAAAFKKISNNISNAVDRLAKVISRRGEALLALAAEAEAV